MPSIEQIEQKLLNPQEAENRLDTIDSYFEITKENQRLIYVLGNHSNDINDPQYRIIRQLFEKFINDIGDNKALIIVERYERGIDFIDEKDAVTQGSEGSFVSYLASKFDIKNVCVEPDLVELSNILGERYSRKYVAFMWFIIHADNWHRGGMKEQVSFDEYVQEKLDYDKEWLGWNDVDFTVNGMRDIFSELLPDRKFDENDGQIFYDMANPFNNLNIILIYKY